MTNEEKVTHWVKLSDEDISVADDLCISRHYLQTAFFCHLSVEKIFKACEMLVKTHSPLPIESVYLFGSYAKGTSRRDSDIDVAFVVNHLDGDLFEIMPLLWKLRRQIDWRIEPHIVARDSDYAGFLDEIQQSGFLIN